MGRLSLSHRLLFGRFLTRMGDQGWDFALPLVLLFLFPDQLRIAATYYFIVRLLHAVLLPRIAAYIDQWDRARAAKFGVYMQLIGVLVGSLSIYLFAHMNRAQFSWTQSSSLLLAISFVLGGALSSLGSAFMDIAVANDLVPSSIPAGEMAAFNSRLRQIDLATEVGAPFIAGFILLVGRGQLLGFYILAVWNLLSFFPELGLLNSIFRERPDLKNKTVAVTPQLKATLVQKLTRGWGAFFSEPVSLVCLAYAFLWLSVLSPHGVLLTAFLKDGWGFPEWGIGIFRGAGALFGLLATVLFPIVVKKYGLRAGSRKFIHFQSLTLLVALALFFSSEALWAQLGFLALVLFSRIGLYGFSLGEMQIRQLEIRPEVRGQVNGFASALTGVATLFLYGFGALLPKTEDFKILIVASVFFVGVATLVYNFWYFKREKSQEISNPHQ